MAEAEPPPFERDLICNDFEHSDDDDDDDDDDTESEDEVEILGTTYRFGKVPPLLKRDELQNNTSSDESEGEEMTRRQEQKERRGQKKQPGARPPPHRTVNAPDDDDDDDDYENIPFSFGFGSGGGVVDEFCKVTGGFDSEAFEQEEYHKKINIFEDDRFFVEQSAMHEGKCGWKCRHCNIFFSGGYNTTKALAHISQSKFVGIKPCNGRIEPDRLAMYKQLHAIRSNKRELKAGGQNKHWAQSVG